MEKRIYILEINGKQYKRRKLSNLRKIIKANPNISYSIKESFKGKIMDISIDGNKI